ncbi:MAG: winged helix DNA-binding domain-containing protein [Actinomycetota bacterium]
MTERVLTTRELNRALLARQLLLERSDLPIDRAIERVAGLQAQYAPSAYIALWTRLANFRRDALTKALEERRAVQGTLMRATIHIVSPRDFYLFVAAIRKTRQEWWFRTQRRELEDVDMDAVAARVREHLADGPRRAREVQGLLLAEGYPRIAVVGIGIWTDIVRVPPSGTWEHRRADLYDLADHWLGLSGVTETEGLEHLVRRYLGGFGPASLKDLASWSGLPTAKLRSVLERVRLRRFRDEHGGELLDVPRAPLPDMDTPAPVRFLPTWDAALLAHARRSQILPEAYRSRVFSTRTPHSIGTFLVDGAVAGGWHYRDGGVRIEPFARLPREILREVEEEGERLTAFHRD